MLGYLQSGDLETSVYHVYFGGGSGYEINANKQMLFSVLVVFMGDRGGLFCLWCGGGGAGASSTVCKLWPAHSTISSDFPRSLPPLNRRLRFPVGKRRLRGLAGHGKWAEAGAASTESQ